MAENMIPTWELGNNPNLYNPQLERNFDLIIMGLDDLTNPLTGTAWDNGKESITISCQNLNEPAETTGTVSHVYQNTEVKFSNGRTTFGDITATVRDLVGADAYGIFKELKRRASNAQTGEAGEPSDYMFNCYVIDRKASTKMINRIRKYSYCFVSEIGGRTHSRDGDNIATFNVTIKTSLMTDESVE